MTQELSLQLFSLKYHLQLL